MKTNQYKQYEMESEISFEQMPSVVMALVDRVDELARKLDDITVAQNVVQSRDEWFDVAALSDYLPGHPAYQTIYCWTHAHAIPYRKNGKRLIFLKSEIDEWVQREKHEAYTSNDAMAEAREYIATHKRK